MKYYDIPGTDLHVSSIIMGCMRIGSLTQKELNHLIYTEIEAGVNFIDHADVYDMGGCEVSFGHAVDLHSSLRERLIIQGKCGIRKENGKAFYDFSKEYIIKATDSILKRLNTEYLDVLLLHRPDILMEPEEVASAFNILKESGKVNYFGLSNSVPMHFELLKKYCDEPLIFDQVQIGAGHTVMFDSSIAANTNFKQGIDRTGYLIEYAMLNNITLQAWSPLQYDMFKGVIINNPLYIDLNNKLEEIGRKYNISKAATAIAWILRHPSKIQVVCGSTDINHVKDYIEATDILLSRADWYDIYESAGNVIP